MKVCEDEGEDGEGLSEAHVVCQNSSFHSQIFDVLAVRHPGQGVHLVRVEASGDCLASLKKVIQFLLFFQLYFFQMKFKQISFRHGLKIFVSGQLSKHKTLFDCYFGKHLTRLSSNYVESYLYSFE